MANDYIINDLRCDYIENPIGIDETNPHFSWLVQSKIRGWFQKAYRIIVVDKEENIGSGKDCLWDSGKVLSDKSINIKYSGENLQPCKKYYWKVYVWGQDDQIAEIEETSCFETGLMKQENWNGKWIGLGKQYISMWSVLLRKEFSLKNIKKARAYISGLGFYELYINGQKVGDHVLDPGQTDYEKRILYATYDVTDMLREGNNALGIMLGDGWYHQSRVWANPNTLQGLSYGNPKAILQLQIELDNCTSISVVTDDSWKGSLGPIVQNNIYAGETYDARIEQFGWNNVGFDDSRWYPATIEEEPGGMLEAQLIPPIKRMEVINPVQITQPYGGIYVLDAGVNTAGWVRMKVSAPAGADITLRYAESLDTNGMIHTDSSGTAHTKVIQTDRYICKGEFEEVYEPRFSYHGFRYVEVTGLMKEPELDTIQIVKVYTSVEEIGGFECSKPVLNILHTMLKDTVTSNIHSIPTDCPAREKCGWTGDAMIMADVFMMNWDTEAFWRKYLGDIETTRQVNGNWMNVSPGKRLCLEAAPAWGSAQVVIPWNLYMYYGDDVILNTCYDAMKGWVYNLLDNWSVDYIIRDLKYPLDDWCPPLGYIPRGHTSPQVSTASFYLCADIMEKVSAITGSEKDIEVFKDMAKKVKEAYNKSFFDYNLNTYGTQTLDCFSLSLGLVPDGKEKEVAKSLADSVIDKDYHAYTGHIGIKYIFPILNEYGYEDIIEKILENNTYPGFAHHISQGATTIWECWELDAKNASLNHPFKGGYDLWLYNYVLGIRVKENGFKRIMIKPQAYQLTHSARGWYDSIYGKIAVDWSYNENNEYKMSVCIPANTSSEVYVFTDNLDSITESGKSIKDCDYIKHIGNEQGSVILEVNSGEYLFEWTR